MGESIHAADFLGADPILGMEVLDLGGNFPRAIGVDEDRCAVGTGNAGIMLRQNSSTPMPTGLTMPMPVTTIRR